MQPLFALTSTASVAVEIFLHVGLVLGCAVRSRTSADMAHWCTVSVPLTNVFLPHKNVDIIDSRNDAHCYWSSARHHIPLKRNFSVAWLKSIMGGYNEDWAVAHVLSCLFSLFQSCNVWGLWVWYRIVCLCCTSYFWTAKLAFCVLYVVTYHFSDLGIPASGVLVTFVFCLPRPPPDPSSIVVRWIITSESEQWNADHFQLVVTCCQ